jgi:hypothetical protein
MFSGIDQLEEGNFIDRDDFDKGYTLFAFDLKLNFKQLKNPINVVINMEFQKMIEIDKTRNVILDFGV